MLLRDGGTASDISHALVLTNESPQRNSGSERSLVLSELVPQNVINIVLFLKNVVWYYYWLLLIRLIASLFVQAIRRFTCLMCLGTKLDGNIWLSNGKTFDVIWHFVRSSELFKLFSQMTVLLGIRKLSILFFTYKIRNTSE